MRYEVKRENVIVARLKLEGRQIREALGEDLIDFSFKSKSPVDLRVGDTIEAFGLLYKLNRPVEPEFDRGVYRYDAKFEAIWYDLADVQFRGLGSTSELTEGEFSIRATAFDIVDLIVRNANRVQSGWTIGVVDETDFRDFVFASRNCKQVLDELATAFSTEFWIDNKTIHLQKREVITNLSLSVGKGDGLYSLRRGNRSDANVVTRLYVEGGSRNLPSNYGAVRLQLPNGKKYLQKAEAEKIIEHQEFFDNIIPERVGVVSGVGDMFSFSDRLINFDVNDAWLDVIPKIGFLSGSLAGYEFELDSYTANSKTFKIRLNDKEKAYPMGLPNVDLKPKVGDKYTIYDIDLPQADVDDASARLEAAGQAYLDKYGEDQFDYYASLTPIYVKDKNPAIELGNRIHIAHIELGVDKHIRIGSYSRSLQNVYEYDLGLTDELSVSEISRQYAQQERILYAIQTAGLLDPEQMRKNLFLNRLSENDGYLLLGNNKVKAGYADNAGHANTASRADTARLADNSILWNGLAQPAYVTQPVRAVDSPKFEGVGSQSYISGWTGHGYALKKDANGNYILEVDGLFVRKEANFYSLVVNELKATNGAVIVSDGIKITGATKTGNNYKCTIDTDGGKIGVPFRFDDVLKVQVWNGKGAKYYVARVLSISSGDFTISILEGSGIPAEGDEIVRIDNFTDNNRKGIVYITASDNGAPYIDTVYGMWTDRANSVRTRMGNLAGIVHPVFGTLSGFGLYAQGAYIDGVISVRAGSNVYTKTDADGKVSTAKTEAINAAASDATSKANTAQSNAISAAALDARNKADAARDAAINSSNLFAQAAVDAVEVGGRNYIRDSEKVILGGAAVGITGVDNGDGTFSVTAAAGNAVYQSIPYPISVDFFKDVKIGDKVIFTISCRVDEGSALPSIHVNNPNSYSKLSGKVSKTNFERVYRVFTWNGGDTIHLHLGFNNLVGKYTFYKPKIAKGNKDDGWSPAPEDVTNALEVVRSENQASFQVLDTAIKSKVSQTDYNALNQVVNAQGTKINQNSTAIEQRATKQEFTALNSTVGGLSGRVSTAEGSITTMAGQIALKASQSDIDTSIGAVRIGGANLIAGTKEEWSTTSTSVSSGSAYGIYKSGADITSVFKNIYGGDVAISFDVFIHNAVDSIASLRVYGWNNSPEYGLSDITMEGLPTRTWLRVSGVGNVYKHPTNKGESLIEFYGEANINTTKISIRKFMLEDGNKPSMTWSPASEDVEASINAVNSRVNAVEINLDAVNAQINLRATKSEVTTAQTNAINTAATDATTKADNAKVGAVNDAKSYTDGEINTVNTTINTVQINLDAANTAIALKAEKSVTDALGTRLTGAESKITDTAIRSVVRSQTEEIVNSAVDAIEVGGSNLITGTKEEWSTTSVSPGSAYGIYKSGADITSVFKNIYGGDVAISFDVFIHNAVDSIASLRVYGWNNSPEYGLSDITMEGLPTRTWLRVSGVGNVYKHPTNKGDSLIEFYGEANINTSKISIRKFMLEDGNKPSMTWSPAPEDVDASIALRPTVSEIKSEFLQTADGFSLFGQEINLNGKVTFNMLNSDAQNRVTTAVNTASAADTKATNAASAAAAAQGTANTANNQLIVWKFPNKTTINGDVIETRSIKAEQIDTVSLFAVDGTFTGNLTANNLYVTQNSRVGEFKIQGQMLYSDKGAGAPPSGIRIQTDGGQRRVSIGADHDGANDGILSRFYDVRNTGTQKTAIDIDVSGGVLDNEGLRIKASKGAIAIRLLSGDIVMDDSRIVGLKISKMVYSSAGTYLLPHASGSIVIPNTGNYTFNLPTAPHDGLVFFWWRAHSGNTGITVNGNGRQVQYQGSVANSAGVSGYGGMIQYIADLNRWCIGHFN